MEYFKRMNKQARAAGDFPASSVLLRTGSPCTIRRVHLDDAEAILAMDTLLIDAGTGEVRGTCDLPKNVEEQREALIVFTELMAHKNGVRLVAVNPEGEFLGSGEALRFPPARLRHVAELSMGVSPRFQGQGVGRALLHRLIEWCLSGPGTLEPAIQRIQLQTRKDNPRAIHLYTSMGFIPEGEMRNFVRLTDGTLIGNLLMRYAPKTEE